jgi:hypothetical protein
MLVTANRFTGGLSLIGSVIFQPVNLPVPVISLWHPPTLYTKHTQQRSSRLLQLIAAPQMHAFYVHKGRPDRFVPMKEGKIENEGWFRRLEKIKIRLCSPQRNTKSPLPIICTVPHRPLPVPLCPCTLSCVTHCGPAGRPLRPTDTHNFL